VAPICGPCPAWTRYRWSDARGRRCTKQRFGSGFADQRLHCEELARRLDETGIGASKSLECHLSCLSKPHDGKPTDAHPALQICCGVNLRGASGNYAAQRKRPLCPECHLGEVRPLAQREIAETIYPLFSPTIWRGPDCGRCAGLGRSRANQRGLRPDVLSLASEAQGRVARGARMGMRPMSVSCIGDGGGTR